MLTLKHFSQNSIINLIMTALVIILLTACAADESVPDFGPPDQGADSPTGEAVIPNTERTNEARLDNVEIAVLESFPVQVKATVSGTLPDGCVQIGQPDQRLEGNTILVSLTTARLVNARCTDEAQPFEQTISLDVLGLPAGSYTVTVSGLNNVSGVFELSVDNVPPQEAGAGPGLGSIRGVVWEDICQLADDGSPAADCIPDGSGGFRADGQLNNGEARLAGVQVTLSPGQCPGNGETLIPAITGADGVYRFTDLPAGPHCLSIDPQSEQNAAILLPGDWSYPGPGPTSTTLNVEAGQTQSVDFGWQRRFEPTAAEGTAPQTGPSAATEAACTDRAAYIADVTIPDDTVLRPDEPFEKTWRVRNDGTCTWGSGYSLVFAGGEQMSGPTRVPLPEVVEPGAEVEVSITLVAPLNSGSYRSDWKFQNDRGTIFGSRGDHPLFVQIIVSGGADAPAGTGNS